MTKKLLTLQLPDLHQAVTVDLAPTLISEIHEKLRRGFAVPSYYIKSMTSVVPGMTEVKSISFNILDGSREPVEIRRKVDLAFTPRASVLDTGKGFYSFEYKNYQVDLFFYGANKALSSSMITGYLSFNGIGSLLKGTATKLGLTFDESGLYMPIKDRHDKIKNMYFTRDFYDSCKIMGFDYNLLYYTPTNTLDNHMNGVSKFLNSSLYFERTDLPELDETRIITDPYDFYPQYELVRQRLASKPPVRVPNSTAENKKHLTNFLKKHYGPVIKSCMMEHELNLKTQLINKKLNNKLIKDTLVELSAGNSNIQASINNTLENFKLGFNNLDEFELFILSATPQTISDKLKSFKPKIIVVTEPKPSLFDISEIGLSNRVPSL